MHLVCTDGLVEMAYGLRRACLPLTTQLPGRLILGKRASDNRHSRKLRKHKKSRDQGPRRRSGCYCLCFYFGARLVNNNLTHTARGDVLWKVVRVHKNCLYLCRRLQRRMLKLWSLTLALA